MKKKIVAVLVNAELVFMSLIVLIPVVWIILSAFQSGKCPWKYFPISLTLNISQIISDDKL